MVKPYRVALSYNRYFPHICSALKLIVRTLNNVKKFNSLFCFIQDFCMKTRFLLICALIIALSASATTLRAQTFTSLLAGGNWQSAATWTKTAPATTFPGDAAPAGTGAVTINQTGTYTDATPAFAITSLALTAPGMVTLQPPGGAGGTLTITGDLTVGAGGLTIDGNLFTYNVVVNGNLTLTGNITLQAFSNITINGNVTGTGTITGTGGANASIVTLGASFNGGSLPGVNFANPFNGRINTTGPLNLSSNLTMGGGANGILSLNGTLTINSGITLSMNNTTAGEVSLPGGGLLQGQSATAVLLLGTTYNNNVIPGIKLANPFNGTLQTTGAGPWTFNNPITIGSTGILNLGGNLTPAATQTLTLNNTAANSLTGAGSISGTAGSSVILGPGFNASAINLANFADTFVGTLQTSGALTLTGGITPIDIDFAANGILSLGGDLTVNTGQVLQISNTVAGAVLGSGRVQGIAGTPNGELRFGNAACGGNIPEANIANPFNGTLQLGTGLPTIDDNVTIGATGVLTLAADLSVDAGVTLTLNQTAAQATSMPIGGPVGVVNDAANSVIVLGANSFAGTVPTDRLGPAGNGTIATGTLRIAGTAVLNAAPDLTMGAGGILDVTGSLTVGSGRTVTLNNTAAGALPGAGTIQGQDNTAQVTLVAAFNGGTLDGAKFANPFNGRINTGGALGLTNTLTMGVSSILNLGGVLTIQASSHLVIGMTNLIGVAMPGAGTLAGVGTTSQVTLSDNALGGIYPTTLILAGFDGKVNIGNNITLNTNYTVNTPTVVQLNGATTPFTVAAGVQLDLNNMAANSVTGTGLMQAVGSTAIINLGSGFNAGCVPGSGFVNPFNGTLRTNSAMTLCSNLTMGAASVLDLAGAVGSHLTVANAVNLTLNATPAASTSLPSANNCQINGPVGSIITLGAGSNSGTIPLGGAAPLNRIADAGAATPFSGTLVIADGLTFPNTPAPITTPATLNVSGTVTVPTGQNLTLTNTSSNALTGTGVLQGASNTAIVTLANGYNASQLPGVRFANPYNGRLAIQGSMNLTSNLTMGTAGILDVGANTLTVNDNITLTLNNTSTGANGPIQGTGFLQGQSRLATVVLGSGVNGSSIPAANLAQPFSGTLRTSSAMTLPSFLTVSAIGALTMGGNITVAASQAITLNNNVANTLTGTGTFVSSDANSRVSFGPGFNGSSLPGGFFTGFAGRITMGGPLTLNGALVQGAGGTFDLGGGSNTLTLGGSNISTGTVFGASSTSFFVTNGGGALTNSLTTSPVTFHIGTTATAYSPVTITNSGAADSYTARATVATIENTNVAGTFPDRTTVAWVISQASSAGAKNAAISLQWNTFDEVAKFDRTKIIVSRVSGTTFTNGPQTASNAALTAGAFVVSSTVTVSLSNTVFVLGTIPPPPPPLTGPQPPVIGLISPSVVTASSDDFDLTITGGIFTSNVSVFVSTATLRMQVSTTNVQQSFLQVRVPGVFRSVAQNLIIHVTNNTTAAGTTGQITVTKAAVPTLTTLAPASTTASGQAYTITLTGTGFFKNFSSVTINGTPLRIMSATTATQVMVEVPPTFNFTTAAYVVRFNNSDGGFAEKTLDVKGGPRPAINFTGGLQPPSTSASTNAMTLIINGSNFFIGAKVRFAGVELTPSSVVGGTKITLVVPGTLLNQEGYPRVEVINPDGQTYGAVFTIRAAVPPGPKPTITSVTPSSTTASSRAFTVKIVGTGYQATSLLAADVDNVQYQIFDSTQILVFIPALSVKATINIGIYNPDGQSVATTVSVGDPLPAPSIASLSPSSTTATSRAFTVTVTGQNFVTGAQVFLSTSTASGLVALPVIQVSATGISAVVPANININLYSGTQPLVIVNPDGQVASTPFTIKYDPITAVKTDKNVVMVQVYPNPAVNELAVDVVLERTSLLTVSLVNAQGQRVMSFSDMAVGQYRRFVSLEGLPVGAYFLEIQNGNQRWVEKVVKQ